MTTPCPAGPLRPTVLLITTDDEEDTVDAIWGPGAEAELAYRREQVARDARAARAARAGRPVWRLRRR